MNEASWELFDALLAQLQAMGRRVGELETRVESLLRQSAARGREAEAFGALPVLRLAEPEQVECDRCPSFHSPELPCPTPVDEAWAKHADAVRV